MIGSGLGLLLLGAIGLASNWMARLLGASPDGWYVRVGLRLNRAMALIGLELLVVGLEVIAIA